MRHSYHHKELTEANVELSAENLRLLEQIDILDAEIKTLRANHAAEKEKVWDKAVEVVRDAPTNRSRIGIVALLKASRTADIKEKDGS